MSDVFEAETPAPTLEGDQSRWTAGVDILLTFAVAGGLYALELALQKLGLLPESGMFTGVITLVGTFFFVWWLVRWRGEGLAVLGLRYPPTWWFVPAWGFVVFVVTIAGQLTLVRALASLFGIPAPDVSQYDLLRGKLGLFVLAASGSMITGGFIEEVIYRGLMVDRLATLFGGGRRGRVFGALGCVPFGLIHYEWGLGGMVGTGTSRLGETCGPSSPPTPASTSF